MYIENIGILLDCEGRTASGPSDRTDAASVDDPVAVAATTSVDTASASSVTGHPSGRTVVDRRRHRHRRVGLQRQSAEPARVQLPADGRRRRAGQRHRGAVR